MEKRVLTYALIGGGLAAVVAFATGSTATGIGVVAVLGALISAMLGYFEQKRQRGDAASTPLAIPIALGVSIGSAVGVALDNHAIGVGVGLAVGIATAAGLRRRGQRHPAARDDS